MESSDGQRIVFLICAGDCGAIGAVPAMNSRRCDAVLGLAFLACACPLPPPLPPKAGPPPPAGEIVLDQGFIVLQLHTPPAPAGPKPTVISLLADQESLLAAGVV